MILYAKYTFEAHKFHLEMIGFHGQARWHRYVLFQETIG